ncbi:MAG: (d)CMP kinase [Mariprofundaceae bacterium]
MTRYHPCKGLTIAIDGPSGSGKGTIAKALSSELGIPLLDTGLLYRFVGWLTLKESIAVEDSEALQQTIDHYIDQLSWCSDEICLNGKSLNSELRHEQVGNLASQVAAQPKVRSALLPLQRSLAQQDAGCIMDGRDIGTVVLPDAVAKFFLTASLQIRARRRWLQLQAAKRDASIHAIITDMQQRDKRDSERQHAPLQQAKDAIRIDSTTLREDEVVDRLLNVLQRRNLIHHL